MDTLGLKEGEEIQHSMITKSIERAQRKVEENNFGIRKRLLEYDDVMNAQREVIYKKRRHALYGERLSLDLQNMLYDLSESVINQFYEDKDYEGFNFELIRIFAIENPISEDQFLNAKNGEELSEILYDKLDEHYRFKTSNTAERAFPVIKNVYEQPGQQYENIVVPFSDGIRNIQVLAPLRKSYESHGKEIISAFERNITLALIDDTWKNHLRDMDDLKQSVQNAVYEQKDPLLVYKLESFNLFKKMVDEVNRDTMSFLFRGNITAQDQTQVKQAAAPVRQDLSKLKTSHEEYQGGSSNGDGMPQNQPAPKNEPIRNQAKILPNDPCPCGSGKKYKKCHGVGNEG